MFSAFSEKLMQKTILPLIASVLLFPALAMAQVTGVTRTSLYDCSITSLTGSASQTILAANVNRRYMEIFNPNASDAIYVNLAGGTAGATATSTGTIQVAHGTSIIFDGIQNMMPINSITVNGTASDAIICYEGR